MRYALKILIFIFFISPCVFAQQNQAVIRELAGTVEVKRANSSVWEAASRGQILELDHSISTGFRSTAVISLSNSLITLRPLTRISIRELTQSSGNEKVELNLQTGRIRADVKAPDGGQTEFIIRSPNSTSSVRGTVFEFDTLQLTVLEGTVEFSGRTGSSYLIDAIGYSRIDVGTGQASYPPAASELIPVPPIASEPILVSPQPPKEVSTPPPGPGSPPTEPLGGGGSGTELAPEVVF